MTPLGRRLLPALAAMLALATAGAFAESVGSAPGLGDAECVACRAAWSELRATFGEEEWAALLAGEVVTSDAGTKSAGAREEATLSAAGIVPGPPEQVWSVVTDWPAYPRFMPNVVETRVRRLEARRAWLSQHLRVFWADIRYGTSWDLAPERGEVRFALDPEVPHDIAGIKGSWRLAPLSDGERTLLRYDVWAETGRPLPEFIERALTRRSLPRVVGSVRGEVARRFAGSR